jgi:hypothetical protein
VENSKLTTFLLERRCFGHCECAFLVIAMCECGVQLNSTTVEIPSGNFRDHPAWMLTRMIRLKDIPVHYIREYFPLISTNNDIESQLATRPKIANLEIPFPTSHELHHRTPHTFAAHMPYDVSRPATLRLLRW